MAGTLTLIGSGEFLPGMVAVHRAVLARAARPQPVFIDTPAGFQTNADELSQAARDFFQKELGVALDVASLRHSNLPAEQIQKAKDQVASANYIVAGPGSPTYAIRHWRAVSLAATFAERLAAGAHFVFASSAVIALGRLALPVYEIYKVGDDPYWADGLDLLGPFGYDLALIPHWNNRDPRCFVGLARFEQLAAQLGPETVILGVDENTAVTLDLDAHTATVAGAGSVTIQHRTFVHAFSSGTAFDLFPLSRPSSLASAISTTLVKSPAPRPPASPTSDLRPPTSSPPGPLYVPDAVRQWAARRDALRAEKKFAEADRLRERIAAIGYAVKDSPAGPVFTLARYANSNAVPSPLDKPDAVEWSATLLAHNNAGEIIRAARSALQWSGGHSLEVVIVDDASGDDTPERLADFACEDDRVRLVFLSAHLGEGAGRNAGLRAARGRHVAILGGHMEIAGDIFTSMSAALADDSVGATGSHPLVTGDLFTFNSAPTPEADAIEFYLFAFRRARLKQVGWLDEKFVFYRNLDLDWSLAFKDQGLRLVAAPDLPLVVHEHPYLRMDPLERDKLSKKNYRRFLDKWKGRTDLLVQNAA